MILTRIKQLIFLVLLLIVLPNLSACGRGKEKISPPDGGNSPETPVVQKITYTNPGERGIPYELGREYRYVFKMLDVEIGSATFKLDKNENNNYRLLTSIDIDNEEFNERMSGESVLVFDENWRLLSYDREMDSSFGKRSTMDGHYSIHARFENGHAHFQHQKPGDDEPKVFIKEIPDDVFLFDNNFIGQMALICTQPRLKTGRTETLRVLSIVQQDFYNLTMTPKIKHEMEFGNRKIIAYEVDMKANDITFGHYFITRNGVMVRAEEEGGRLVIMLETGE
ncbi:hypothetical protein J7L05_06110 [bacterium]|nr:hypothetical protein [bacterium]